MKDKKAMTEEEKEDGMFYVNGHCSQPENVDIIYLTQAYW
jgi:hypothetical protein